MPNYQVLVAEISGIYSCGSLSIGKFAIVLTFFCSHEGWEAVLNLQKKASYMKNVYSFMAGAVGAFLLPVYPYAGFCTVLAVIEVLSEYSRRSRLRGHCMGPEEPVVYGLWHRISALVKIYVALMVSHGADLTFGVNYCLRFMGAAISVHQGLTILEYESAAGGAPWASRLHRYLSDKIGDGRQGIGDRR